MKNMKEKMCVCVCRIWNETRTEIDCKAIHVIFFVFHCSREEYSTPVS